ncbi:MAG: thioredoxin family protein [bacterium]
MNSQNSNHKIELFYNPLCNMCPAAKEIARAVAEEQQVWLEEINVFTQEGGQRAEKYGVRGVPTIIVDGEKRIVGIPDKEQLISMLK